VVRALENALAAQPWLDAHYFETITKKRATWNVARWIHSLFGGCNE
jgi:hypothetical protein